GGGRLGGRRVLGGRRRGGDRGVGAPRLRLAGGHGGPGAAAVGGGGRGGQIRPPGRLPPAVAADAALEDGPDLLTEEEEPAVLRAARGGAGEKDQADKGEPQSRHQRGTPGCAGQASIMPDFGRRGPEKHAC